MLSYYLETPPRVDCGDLIIELFIVLVSTAISSKSPPRVPGTCTDY